MGLNIEWCPNDYIGAVRLSCSADGHHTCPICMTDLGAPTSLWIHSLIGPLVLVVHNTRGPRYAPFRDVPVALTPDFTHLVCLPCLDVWRLAPCGVPFSD